jgi:manganese transport protein
MPHNLYLHSALVQTRIVDEVDNGKRQACQWNLVDTALALNAAFFVNSAILVLSSAVFHKNGVVVTELQQAHELLTPLLGTTLASTLFAVALLCAGQSSTLTGTLAGQIVMEGFLQLKIRPWLRRLITRLIAIIPAVGVISLKGESGSYDLLILSQVILSLQLPFAVIPLIQFTSDKVKMGSFVNTRWVKVLAWTAAVIIVGLNANLVVQTISDWIADAGENELWLWVTVVPIAAGCGLFLLYVTFYDFLKRGELPVPETIDFHRQQYKRIGVSLDYGTLDVKVLTHAQSLAKQSGAEMYLFHIVEGVSGQLFGREAADEEAREDQQRLEALAEQVRQSGVLASAVLGYGDVPEQLVKLAKEYQIDLLVMGGHRHRGLKDLLFGASISKVRHRLSIPVFVVQ